ALPPQHCLGAYARPPHLCTRFEEGCRKTRQFSVRYSLSGYICPLQTLQSSCRQASPDVSATRALDGTPESAGRDGALRNYEVLPNIQYGTHDKTGLEPLD